MIVIKKNVDCSWQEVEGDVYCFKQKVKGDMFCVRQEVKGNMYCSYQEVKGNMNIEHMKVGDKKTTKLIKEFSNSEQKENEYTLTNFVKWLLEKGEKNG